MLNIGETPQDFTLQRYDTGVNVTLSSFTGKIILVSFINFDQTVYGWPWLKNMINIQTAINTASLSSQIQLLAVIFRNPGSVDQFEIAPRIAADPDLAGKITFPVLMDNDTSAGSFAITYMDGFAGTTDPSFHANTGSALWSYKISKEFQIVDKWTPYCLQHTITGNTGNNGSPIITGVSDTSKCIPDTRITGSGITPSSVIVTIDSATQVTLNQNATATASGVTLTIGNNDPLSFRHISIPSTPAFESIDYALTEKYIIQRMTNLINAPSILSVSSSVTNPLKSVSPVQIALSKLFKQAPAETPSNFSLSGSGSASLSVSNADFSGRNQVENVVELTIAGTLQDGSLNITLSPAITDTSGTPINTSENTIHYTIDLPPRITGLKINPR